ncbi:MAG: methylmalonyl-CoA decarboxylase [Ignavibacteriae bacterium]|nr:methylmalonyl-CoA decarboxylase [Ignavibacteriota bacterium]
MPLILSSIRNKTGIIQFNNYEKRNALSSVMIKEIVDCLEDFKRKNLRVVIIRADKGSKVWSSGHDITELAAPGTDPLSYDNPLELLLRAVENFPAPVIAMVEGTVWGGACELAFTCDILIGAPNVTFAITPAKIGVPYNSNGILHFINMLGMSAVKEMFFTAQPVSAEKAEKLGLLNHMVPLEELETFTYGFADDIACNSPLAINVIKEQLNILGKAHPLSPAAFERITQLRKAVYESEDYKEGIKAFLERRKPDFKGKE